MGAGGQEGGTMWDSWRCSLWPGQRNRCMALTPAACHLHLHPLLLCHVARPAQGPPPALNLWLPRTLLLPSWSHAPCPQEQSRHLHVCFQTSDQRHWTHRWDTPNPKALNPKPTTKINKTPSELRAAQIKKAHCKVSANIFYCQTFLQPTNDFTFTWLSIGDKALLFSLWVDLIGLRLYNFSMWK